MSLLVSEPGEICTNLNSQDLLRDQLPFCQALKGGGRYGTQYPIIESLFQELRVQVRELSLFNILPQSDPLLL